MYTFMPYVPGYPYCALATSDARSKESELLVDTGTNNKGSEGSKVVYNAKPVNAKGMAYAQFERLCAVMSAVTALLMLLYMAVR